MAVKINSNIDLKLESRLFDLGEFIDYPMKVVSAYFIGDKTTL